MYSCPTRTEGQTDSFILFIHQIKAEQPFGRPAYDFMYLNLHNVPRLSYDLDDIGDRVQTGQFVYFYTQMAAVMSAIRIIYVSAIYLDQVS